MRGTPVAMREAELSHPLAGITTRPEYGAAVVLARWYSEPVALAEVPLADGRATAEQVARSVWPSVERLARARLAAAGEPRSRPALAGPGGTAGPEGDQPRPDLAGPCPDHPAGHARRNRAAPDFPAELLTSGLRQPWPPAYLVGRAAVLHNAPPASVIVCTRGRAADLARALTAVLGQDYPDFEVIVVDSAPVGDATAALVAQRQAAGTRGVPLRRVVEPSSGSPRAWNAGLAAASGTIVACLSDDARPDRHWLAELARGFAYRRRVVAVSGLVLPAALITPGRALGHRLAGPGLMPAVIDPAADRRHPRPAFGAGGPTAFTRAALTGIGGFSITPGALAPAGAGDDVALGTDPGLSGGSVVYWPGAVAWRRPR